MGDNPAANGFAAMRACTVIDRLKHLGVETDKHQRWEIGAAVREKYKTLYGELPEKELRRKTDGLGSHCFAVYPEHFTSIIDSMIGQYKLQQEKQLDLFS